MRWSRASKPKSQQIGPASINDLFSAPPKPTRESHSSDDMGCREWVV